MSGEGRWGQRREDGEFHFAHVSFRCVAHPSIPVKRTSGRLDLQVRGSAERFGLLTGSNNDHTVDAVEAMGKEGPTRGRGQGPRVESGGTPTLWGEGTKSDSGRGRKVTGGKSKDHSIVEAEEMVSPKGWRGKRIWASLISLENYHLD